MAELVNNVESNNRPGVARRLLGWAANLFSRPSESIYGWPYVIDTDGCPPRREDDLPLDDVYEVLKGLDRYREPALASLRRDSEAAESDDLDDVSGASVTEANNADPR